MRLLINAAMRVQFKQSKSILHFSFAPCSSSCRWANEMSKEFEEKLEGYTVIREGEAKILMNSNNSVFYNRAQVMIPLFLCFFRLITLLLLFLSSS